MERKKALAIASAATLVLGGGIVAAASFTGTSILGFGASASAHASGAVGTPTIPRPAAKERVVVHTRDVYDRFVVDTSTVGTAAPEPTAPTVTAPAAVEPAFTPTPTSEVARPATEPARSGDGPGASDTPPSVPPATAHAPTTLAPSAPTTRPPGVPDDWPTDKPIPPMPPNCFQAELHLNGVWSCQGPDD